MKRIALAMCCAAVCGTASAGLFGPSNYEECVLENVKGVGSDIGARMVAAACAKQYPSKKPAEKAAPVPPATDNGTAPRITDPSGRFTDFRPDPPK